MRRFSRLGRPVRSLLILFLSAVLVSCGGSVTDTKRSAGADDEALERYLTTADHLSEEQRQAIKEGRPFIGMTEEEANLSMTESKVQATRDGKLLRAQFRDRAGREFKLEFDRGSPNRVLWWSGFTDAEVRDLTRHRDVHPRPPLILLPTGQ